MKLETTRINADVNALWDAVAETVTLAEDGASIPPAPVAGIVEVEGRHLQLVNWFDYKGFEVREYSQSMSGSRVLGFLSVISDFNGDRWAIGDPADRRDSHRFPAGALRALLVKAGAL